MVGFWPSMQMPYVYLCWIFSVPTQPKWNRTISTVYSRVWRIGDEFNLKVFIFHQWMNKLWHSLSVISLRAYCNSMAGPRANISCFLALTATIQWNAHSCGEVKQWIYGTWVAVWWTRKKHRNARQWNGRKRWHATKLRPTHTQTRWNDVTVSCRKPSGFIPIALEFLSTHCLSN